MSAAAGVTVRAAAPADAEAIRELLTRNRLPTADLATSHPEFLVACEGERIIGTGALERFGRIALLRSLAVETGRRGSGIGCLMVAELERRARDAGIGELVLLTETARDFFAHRGYEILDRRLAPESVQGSAEFRSLCPASAVCMRKLTAARTARS